MTVRSGFDQTTRSDVFFAENQTPCRPVEVREVLMIQICCRVLVNQAMYDCLEFHGEATCSAPRSNA